MRCLINETNFRIPENIRAENALSWAQESVRQSWHRQASQQEIIYWKLPLISDVKHKWKTSWFDDAIKELGEIDEEIVEEGYPSINDNTKETAKQILIDLNTLKIESSPYVYPTIEGEIAIDFKSKNYSILILVINEKIVETYSSFYDSDTEYHKYTIPFENIFDFTISQLRALREA